MENKNTEIYFSQRQTDFLCRLVFAVILIDLVFSAFSNTLIHQLQSPVLKFAYVDPTFWVMHLLKIPVLISSNFYLSWFWDVVLFVSCIGVLIFPQKKWVIVIFIIFYFVYYVIFNSYGAHHTHSLAPFLIAPVPFLFSKKSFTFSWQALRYFLLFSYSAAFLWKLFRFSWLQSNQGILIVKKNLTPYLFFNPHTFLAGIYFWLLNHLFFVEVIFFTGFILEGLFIIGFFTKKFDRLLFIISLLLPFGFWFMADAVFYELVILSITLLPVSAIAKFSERRFI
jgi:hypothetical protein